MKKIVFLLLVVLILGQVGCSKSMSKSKVLLVIPSHDVQDFELSEVEYSLNVAEIKYDIVSLEGKLVIGMSGGEFEPDMAISQVDIEDYKMVVCIGGNGAYDLWDNEEVLSLVTDFYNNDKYVAAICAAPGILANANILDGKEATCFPDPEIISLLREKGAEYGSLDVIISGKVITGNGPGASMAFGDALVELLNGA